MINEPRINALNTSANPLMIVGIFIFISPFFMAAVGDSNLIIKLILHVIGGVLFALGLMVYVSENY